MIHEVVRWHGMKVFVMQLKLLQAHVLVLQARHACTDRAWSAHQGVALEASVPQEEAPVGHTQACASVGAQAGYPQVFSQCCFSVPGPSVGSPSIDAVALFHPATKSRDDLEAKLTKGSGMGNATKTMAYFEEIARCAHRP